MRGTKEAKTPPNLKLGGGRAPHFEIEIYKSVAKLGNVQPCKFFTN